MVNENAGMLRLYPTDECSLCFFGVLLLKEEVLFEWQQHVPRALSYLNMLRQRPKHGRFIFAAKGNVWISDNNLMRHLKYFRRKTLGTTSCFN